MRLPTLPQKLAILGLTLLAFLLRAYRLDFQSYWIDEAWTVYFANLSIDQLWHLLQTTEIKPPFYFPSTVYYTQLVGDSEYALRFYSLIFGVMAIPFTYRLGKDLGDDRLGLILALLMAVAPYQIWHSQEARPYAFLTAASAMSMWGFVNLWQRGGWRWWLVYVVGTEWAIMIHYHGAVLIGIQGLFLLLTWRRHWRGYLAWAGTLLLILLLYVPWLIFGSSLLQSYVNWIEQPTLWDSFLRSLLAYSLNELVPRAQAIPLMVPFVLVYSLGLLYASRCRWGRWTGPEMLALLVSYTIAPHLAAWIYGELKTVVYLERYMILVQVGYLLTIAVGILAIADGLPASLRWVRPTAKMRTSNRAGAVVAALILLLLVSINGWVLSQHYFNPAYAKPDWRAVADTIETLELPGDAVLLTGDGGENAFDFYYQGDLPVYASFNLLPPLHPDYRKGRKGPQDVDQIMTDLAVNHRRIWFIPYGVAIDPVLERWLADNTYPAWHRWLSQKRLALYDSQVVTDRLEPLETTFIDPTTGQGPTLLRAALPRATTAAGDLLPLDLTWQTATSLPTDYQLSLRLVNQQGDSFAQSDWPPLATSGPPASWPPNQPVTDHRSLWLPPDIPPGPYALQLVVYEPLSGQPLGQPALIPNIAVDPARIVVPPSALPIPNLMDQPLASLSLVGYALPDQIQPGQEMWLWLYWQRPSQATPLENSAAVRLTLTSQEETVSADFSLAEAVGPLDSWQPGQVRRAVYHLQTSPRLAGEQARLSVALLTPGGQPEAQTGLSTVALETRPRQFEPPPIAHPTDITFGRPPLLKLLGYDRPPTVPAANQSLPVTLYWQAAAEMDTNYTVFLQLLGQTGQVVAQVDLQPQAGAAPTTTWLPGEILTDPYTLILPPDLPPGNYQLITGLYHPATGERLPVSSGGDFVELEQVPVK